MGLKCSLFGHAFEPADIEREREEQGNEVVTVVRELERCIRCGKERVTSETTEVTAVVDADEVREVGFTVGDEQPFDGQGGRGIEEPSVPRRTVRRSGEPVEAVEV
jgi:hypothetical protein